MRVGIMSTNNGSHPPEKWASESANQIADAIKIEQSSIVYEAMKAEKQKFIGLLTQALVEHHDEVQQTEKLLLGEKDFDRLEDSTDPDMEHLAEAVAAVQACADQTLFGAHFRKPEVAKFVESTLGSHFATVKQVERSWFADKHLDHPKARAFKEKQNY